MLLIGLDAADRELIERWSAEGLLPNISRMRAGGTWARLKTTAEVLHVSAWPSIFTGTPPDRHGLYHAYVMQQGVQAPVRPRPELCPVPFMWQLLDERDKRCVVVDAFLTCPIKNFKGAQIVDWGSWTWFGPQTILPEPLGRQIASRFGPYPAEDHSKVGMTPPPDPEGFRDRLVAAVGHKAEVVQWLMASQDWDFFLAVFGECHAAGHYFWHYQDEDYVAYPQQCAPKLRTALRDVYVALDSAIGRLLDAAGEDTLVCVISGDGMGANYSGSHLLTPLLEKMRLFNDPGQPQQQAKQRRDLLSRLRGLVPKSLRAVISRTLLPRSVNEKLSLRWKTAGIAWERTRAFVIENANEGFIRINLRGREPRGVVEQGEEYRRLRDALFETARGLINPSNGRAAALGVYKPQEMYSGECREQMPDIVITWDLDARVTRDLSAETCGHVHCPQAPHELMPYYTGNHKADAFAILSGPGVAAGGVLEGASILDIAPSVLARLGIAPPPHMEGHVREVLAGAPVSRGSQ